MRLFVLIASIFFFDQSQAQTTDVFCKVVQVNMHTNVNGTLEDESFYLCERYPQANQLFQLEIDPDSKLMKTYRNKTVDTDIYISFPSTYPINLESVFTVYINATDTTVKVYNGTTLVRRTLRGGNPEEYLPSRKLAKAVGTSRALIVLVSTPDASPLKTADCAQAEFLRAAQQYALCSNNGFNLTLYQVINVNVSRSILRYNYVSLYMEAKQMVSQYFGLNKNTDPATGLGIDHVLYHVPFGMNSDQYSSGFSFAAVGGSFSFFQSKMFSASVIQHELGHNLGLNHARELLPSNPDMDQTEDPEYGDDSSIMGSSFFENTVDQGGRCFNGANYYLLGWYQQSVQDLTAKTSGQYRAFPLGTITNPDDVQVKAPMVIKIDDHFVFFNRKDKFNIKTVEYGDKVVITRAMKDGGTDLRGVLSPPGGSGPSKFTAGNITVEVCSTDYRDHMNIVVGRNVGCEVLTGECFNSPMDYVTVVSGSTYVRKQCSQVLASECTLLDNLVSTSASPVWKTCPNQCPAQSGCGK